MRGEAEIPRPGKANCGISCASANVLDAQVPRTKKTSAIDRRQKFMVVVLETVS